MAWIWRSEAGEIFGLLGPNGAGKTTTVGVCTTRVRPTAGRVLVEGKDVTDRPGGVKRSIGVVTQQNTLDRSCTVRENLYYHCRFFGMGGREAAQRTDEVLQQLRADRSRGRDSYDSSPAGWLNESRSPGPSPTGRGCSFSTSRRAGLDPQSRLAFWELVADLRTGGMTVLLTTHYMEEADRLSDRRGHHRPRQGAGHRHARRVSSARLGAGTVVELHLDRPEDKPANGDSRLCWRSPK